jgi:protein-S-isoprenylcysteine O-methyltransferase Ste14
MNDENTFRILLIVVSIIQTAISARYLRRARAGSTIFRRRDEGLLLTATTALFYLAYGLGLLAYFVNPNWMAWSAVVLVAWVRWIGIAPLLLGGASMIWGLRYLGRNLTISVSTRPEHALITTGPYRWVRHPLYAGGMIESVGVCLLTANWFVALSAGLFWALIALRTPIEEQKLIEKFGNEYRQYMQNVGRFAPKVR